MNIMITNEELVDYLSNDFGVDVQGGACPGGQPYNVVLVD